MGKPEEGGEEVLRVDVKRIGWAALAVYGASIVLANWLIRNVGPIVIPGGNHLAPVGFGLAAPTGTYAAGLTFVCRDIVQRTIGKRWSLFIIVPGAALSALLDVQLAVASGSAFLLGELADFAIYTPLQRRGLVRAVFASEVAASLVDSVLFLGLAGIPLAAAFPGLMLGKLYVGVVTVPLIAYLRERLAAAIAVQAVRVAPAPAPAAATVDAGGGRGRSVAGEQAEQ